MSAGAMIHLNSVGSLQLGSISLIEKFRALVVLSSLASHFVGIRYKAVP